MKEPRILFFDDEEIRYRRLIGKSSGVDMEWTATCSGALECLKAYGPYDIACLDHDVSGLSQVCGRNCGCVVAKYIKEMPARKVPLLVIVHSWNPDGATRMLGELDGQGAWQTIRAPFGSFWFRDKEVIIGD